MQLRGCSLALAERGAALAAQHSVPGAAAHCRANSGRPATWGSTSQLPGVAQTTINLARPAPPPRPLFAGKAGSEGAGLSPFLPVGAGLDAVANHRPRHVSAANRKGQGHSPSRARSIAPPGRLGDGWGFWPSWLVLFSPAVAKSSAIAPLARPSRRMRSAEAGRTLRRVQGHADGSPAARSEREWRLASLARMIATFPNRIASFPPFCLLCPDSSQETHQLKE
ncbi:uncharacterized protein LOC129085405 [Pteronotus mesoamericanus]|uniref:uncharacterized protein LOC129085405 n=1 Tax=Pteronotus mesoamericanus TaxID=1884717 RepID=UPI0023ECC268|nr:uncharacterized protein LOC129085405 [Pteronotus parnellii mesoamericanus]